MISLKRTLRLVPILVVLALALPSRAADDPGEFSIRETLPLDAGQRAKLREVAASDPEARALFAQLEEEARRHLQAEPQPLRVIHYEGLVNTDPRRIESVRHLRQMDDAAAILHYWQATADQAAAEALKRRILAWSATYKPTGNDVNENKLYPLFVAYEALRPDFSAADREVVDDWIRTIAEKHAANAAKPRNLTNRFTKSLRMLAIFGRILDHEPWREASHRGLKRFVTESLRPDGGSFDLEHRDSLTYHNSALRPLIELAIIEGPGGEALYTWSPENGGGSIKRSVDFVRPYAAGEKQRQEWVNSQVSLDQRRAEAGLEKYRKGRLFDPADALPLLEQASYFDATLAPLVLKLHRQPAKRFASWTMVINEACRVASRE